MNGPSRSNEPMLTINEVAERLNVSDRTVQRWITSGALPVHRLGRMIRIAGPDLKAFLAIKRAT